MRIWRYGLGGLGVAAVLFGLHGLVYGGVATHWPAPAVWLVAGVLAHDLVLVPLLAAGGWVLALVAPARVRGVVRGGLLVAAVLTVVALPMLSGKGDASNASLTPLDYPRNYALLLAAIAVATAVLGVLKTRRGRRTGRVSPTRGGG